jgi:probable HAF family extracellular repeat protein
MKSRFLMCFTVMIFAMLAVAVRLAAQDNQDHKHKHHHYQLIVIGTLGGPQSYGDAGHGAANINNRGTAIGTADTATPDPYYPNFNHLITAFGPDPFVYHVFEWKDGFVTDLGSLPGANSSTASFVTENGLVSGQSLNGAIDPLMGWPEETAVLWKHGQIINLGTLGGYESGAGRVNSDGQVAGFSGNAVLDPYSLFGIATQTRAFLWDEDHGMQDLGTLGGPDAVAPYINESGQVAGFSYTSSLAVDPFLWDHGAMIDLGTLGGTFGGPGDLNNRGQVTGTSNLVGDVFFHPFLWTASGSMRDLGTLGGSFGFGNAINDAGEVVGGATIAGDVALHAFFWKRGLMTDLGTVAGYDCIEAFGINSRSQVVGQAETQCGVVTGSFAFLWENGDLIDLNVFVPPGSDVTLQDMEQINDREEMFGIGTLPSGNARAFVLIPCDENHPGIKGCDYSMMEVPAAAPETNPAIRNAASRMLPQSLMRRMNRYHFPGPALGPRN